MSPETAKRALVWALAASGPMPQAKVHWFGYEPMMSFKLIKEMTDWGDDLLKGTLKTFKWGITSNLTLITAEANQFLKKHDFYVLCSLDGTQESHDLHRKYPDGSGSFKDAIRGFKRLMQWNKDRTVRWTIAPDTIDQIIPGTEFYLDLGTHLIAHEFVHELEWKKADLEALETELEKLIPIIIEHTRHADKPNKGKGQPQKQEKHFHPLPNFKPFRDGWRIFSDQRMKDRCGLGRGDIGINADGEFYLCHRFVDQKPHQVGDLWKGLNTKKLTAIQKAWSTDKIVSWRGLREDCFMCIGRQACNGACLATNWDVNGNYQQPSRAHCDLLKVKVRLAIRLEKALRAEGLLKKYNESERRKG